ncbi:MAG: hypothetical protein M3209_05900 [Acidobacteriota bacterium]|nr:hypothetical protein [Acidobacteriota bacterium]
MNIRRSNLLQVLGVNTRLQFRPFSHLLRTILFLAVLCLFSETAFTQTTAFTYQGRLSDNAIAANGSYQMQFALYDAAANGNQIGSTVENAAVAVSGGIFSVQLDFGSLGFPGAERYLEVRVRRNANESYVAFPRERVASVPYAVQALNAETASNATKLGGTAANQFVQTMDARLSDARQPTPGSSNYVQNSTVQQTADFNISGTGKASAFDSANGYKINGSRVFSAEGSNNVFAGVNTGTTSVGNSFFGAGAGGANTTGYGNSFMGELTGSGNTTGIQNTFIGKFAGRLNTIGSNNTIIGANANFASGATNLSFATAIGASATVSTSNTVVLGRSGGQDTVQIPGALNIGSKITTNSTNAIFGKDAGLNNTTGTNNSFFGKDAGKSNTGGITNSFFGVNAGSGNTNGYGNTFMGESAGHATTIGYDNTFIGKHTGGTNTTGIANTLLGAGANVAGENLLYATAIGSGATVSTSNTVVLGRNWDTVRIPGNLVVSGSIAKGSGSFRIDHPLDPKNKYLYHSFVESPDMMNIYNGNVVTNEKGEALITLPAYFDALNRDFRYQLTAIGQFAQAIVSEEIKGNQFRIKTDKPNVKVSWQVTGIRKDKFAEDNPIKVEVEKTPEEKGSCQYAALCQR